MSTLTKTYQTLGNFITWTKRLSSPEYDMLAASLGPREFDEYDTRHGGLNEDTEDALRDQ